MIYISEIQTLVPKKILKNRISLCIQPSLGAKFVPFCSGQRLPFSYRTANILSSRDLVDLVNWEIEATVKLQLNLERNLLDLLR